MNCPDNPCPGVHPYCENLGCTARVAELEAEVKRMREAFKAIRENIAARCHPFQDAREQACWRMILQDCDAALAAPPAPKPEGRYICHRCSADLFDGAQEQEEAPKPAIEYDRMKADFERMRAAEAAKYRAGWLAPEAVARVRQALWKARTGTMSNVAFDWVRKALALLDGARP
jgi:hypothetical protein